MIAVVAKTPVAIARGCLDVVNLSQEVERHTRGPMLSDVRTVRRLAGAAMAAALDIAEQNVALHSDDPAAQARLLAEIAHLR